MMNIKKLKTTYKKFFNLLENSKNPIKVEAAEYTKTRKDFMYSFKMILIILSYIAPFYLMYEVYLNNNSEIFFVIFLLIFLCSMYTLNYYFNNKSLFQISNISLYFMPHVAFIFKYLLFSEYFPQCDIKDSSTSKLYRNNYFCLSNQINQINEFQQTHYKKLIVINLIFMNLKTEKAPQLIALLLDFLINYYISITKNDFLVTLTYNNTDNADYSTLNNYNKSNNGNNNHVKVETDLFLKLTFTLLVYSLFFITSLKINEHIKKRSQKEIQLDTFLDYYNKIINRALNYFFIVIEDTQPIFLNKTMEKFLEDNIEELCIKKFSTSSNITFIRDSSNTNNSNSILKNEIDIRRFNSSVSKVSKINFNSNKHMNSVEIFSNEKSKSSSFPCISPDASKGNSNFSLHYKYLIKEYLNKMINIEDGNTLQEVVCEIKRKEKNESLLNNKINDDLNDIHGELKGYPITNRNFSYSNCNGNDIAYNNNHNEIKDSNFIVKDGVNEISKEEYIEKNKSISNSTSKNYFISNNSNNENNNNGDMKENIDSFSFLSRKGTSHHAEYVFNKDFYFEVFIHINKSRYISGTSTPELIEIEIYNITNAKKAEMKMKEQSEERQKFLSRVAHEFKTPLYGIISLCKKINENCQENKLGKKEAVQESKDRNLDDENSYILLNTKDKYRRKKKKNNNNSNINNNLIGRKINSFNNRRKKDNVTKIQDVISNHRSQGLKKTSTRDLKKQIDYYMKDLKSIENLSNYVIFLVVDFIQASKGNELKMEIEKINLHEILKFCYEVLKTLLWVSDKSVKVEAELNIEKRLKEVDIYSDEVRLKQILLNLISNSVKFTKFGKISLFAKYIIHSNEVILLVSDSGSGMNPDQMRK